MNRPGSYLEASVNPHTVEMLELEEQGAQLLQRVQGAFTNKMAVDVVAWHHCNKKRPSWMVNNKDYDVAVDCPLFTVPKNTKMTNFALPSDANEWFHLMSLGRRRTRQSMVNHVGVSQ